MKTAGVSRESSQFRDRVGVGDDAPHCLRRCKRENDFAFRKRDEMGPYNGVKVMSGVLEHLARARPEPDFPPCVLRCRREQIRRIGVERPGMGEADGIDRCDKRFVLGLSACRLLRFVGLHLLEKAVPLRRRDKYRRGDLVLCLRRMDGDKLDMLVAAPVLQFVKQCALRGRKLEFQIEALRAARDVRVARGNLDIRGGKRLGQRVFECGGMLRAVSLRDRILPARAQRRCEGFAFAVSGKIDVTKGARVVFGHRERSLRTRRRSALRNCCAQVVL